MASRVVIKDKRRGLDELKRELAAVKRAHVVIGITHAAGGEVLTYANANEFGATLKARAGTVTTYRQVNKAGTGFNKKGRFVKKEHSNFSQVHAASFKGRKIPSRPFMRSYYDENMKKIGDFASKRFLELLTKPGGSPQQVFSAIGLYVQDGIKNRIRTAKSWAVPNAKSTIAKKGSDKPLIDHGIMINNVTFDIRKGR